MRKLITYAFIDSQNLNLGIQDCGWKLDYKKFFKFLQDSYHIQKAFLFIGHMPSNQKLYDYLDRIGFDLVFKPTREYIKDGKKTTKGNVDAEIVLYSAAKTIDRYDQAVVVSGDGDYYCLYEYLEEKGKLAKILIPNKLKYSGLLKPYIAKFDFVSTKRVKLEKYK